MRTLLLVPPSLYDVSHTVKYLFWLAGLDMASSARCRRDQVRWAKRPTGTTPGGWSCCARTRRPRRTAAGSWWSATARTARTAVRPRTRAISGWAGTARPATAWSSCPGCAEVVQGRPACSARVRRESLGRRYVLAGSGSLPVLACGGQGNAGADGSRRCRNRGAFARCRASLPGKPEVGRVTPRLLCRCRRRGCDR